MTALPAVALARILRAAPRLLLWSGEDEADSDRQRDRLAARLAVAAPESFAETVAAWNLCERGDGPLRGAAVAAGTDEAMTCLRGARSTRARLRPAALLFAGQGAQYPRMAAGLYGFEPRFTAAMDEFFGHAGPTGGRLRADWLAHHPVVPMDDVCRAQPLLFGVGHALARSIAGWGVPIGALLGHSVGEIVAGVIAGVFSLADAVSVLGHRVALADDQPPGGMLAVGAAAEMLAPYLGGQVVVGAINGPRQTVLAGPAAPLAAVAKRLHAAGIIAMPVASPIGFHSPAVDDLAMRGMEVVSRVRLAAPQVPVYSAYTAAILTTERARDPWFWSRQVADPVLFWPALNRLLNDGDFLLIEAGPAPGLSTVARAHPRVRSGTSAVVCTLPPRPGSADDDRRTLLTAAARVWTEGHDVTPAG